MLYEYTGTTPNNFSYKLKNSQGKFIQSQLNLSKGKTVDLDEKSDFVKSLLSRGLLKEADKQETVNRKNGKK